MDKRKSKRGTEKLIALFHLFYDLYSIFVYILCYITSKRSWIQHHYDNIGSKKNASIKLAEQ